jgi:hypothetical protein
MSGSVHAEDWKLGQTWTYQHEGSRPLSDASTTVEGDRVIAVVAVKGAGSDKRYLLKNTWGKNDVNAATSYIDSNAMVHKTDIESLETVLFAPPIPAVWTSLKAGKEKILKTNMSVSGFSIPLTYTAKRLKDETLIVPAGTFKDCVHVQIVSSMENPMTGGTSKSRIDQWYHPQVKNFVKETTVTNYQADNSYSATSVLKSCTKGN